MTASIVGTPVNTGTGLGVTATSLTFSRPSNVLQIGDYVLAFFGQRGSASAPGTPPSGWTQGAFQTNVASPGGGTGFWYRRFTSQAEIDSDTGSYTASFSARALVASCAIVRNANGLSTPTTATLSTGSFNLTIPGITAAGAALALAWLGRSGTGNDLYPPSGFTELADFNDDVNQEAQIGFASRSFSAGATGDQVYSNEFSTNRLSGGMVLFYDSNPAILNTSTRAKSIISQTTINTTTVQNQATARPQIALSISNTKQLKPTSTSRSQISQSAQNPTQLIQNVRLAPQHQTQLLNPTTLLQQLRTKPQINLTFNTLQDPVLVSFRTNLKPQIIQSLIAQKTLTQQVNVQNTISQSAQNTSRIHHSVQINQNVLVNVQNQTRLIQTVQNKPLSRQTVQNSSTLRSIVKLLPLVDTRINVANTEILLSFRTLAIAQIRQKTESPQPLYISTHINHHASIICQGTLIRPKFSLGLTKEFFLTRPTAKFTKV